MHIALIVTALVVAIPLQLLVIAAMLQGGYRRFPVVFGYAVASFLATVTDLSLCSGCLVAPRGNPAAAAHWYWPLEAVLRVLVFAVVVSLIYRASARLRARRMVRALLILGAVVLVGLSFFIHYGAAGPGLWMPQWLRDVSFCAAILDLALWALLIATDDRNHRLLMLSGALGIQFTGESIGASLRAFSPTAELAGEAVRMVANLVTLYLWWQAFRREPALSEAGETAHLAERPNGLAD